MIQDRFSGRIPIGNHQEEPIRFHRPEPASTIDEDCGRQGRSTRPDIKLGICGEHGGDPDSVKFCHRIGLSYVSCSPFRVPVARLAAAQAALEEESAKKKKK